MMKRRRARGESSAIDRGATANTTSAAGLASMTTNATPIAVIPYRALIGHRNTLANWAVSPAANHGVTIK
jgi:hypothetical protein